MVLVKRVVLFVVRLSSAKTGTTAIRLNSIFMVLSEISVSIDQKLVLNYFRVDIGRWI